MKKQLFMGLSDMEIAEIEQKRKRLFLYFCTLFSLPVIIGFTVLDFMEGDYAEFIINLLMALVFITGFAGVKKGGADVTIYRAGLILLSLFFLYNTLIGSGKGTAIYWLFPFPLAYVFFLGKNQGGALCALFLFLLSLVLFNPFSFDIHPYNAGVGLRFLTSLLLVTLMAYALEASREEYGRMLIEKNKTMHEEKQRLEKALDEIKTLSGLIPICSNCKKVRDDQGYWQQVEVYVRDRSSADFSHGICPDCAEKLYPGLMDRITKAG